MNISEISIEKYQQMTIDEKEKFYLQIKKDNTFTPAIRQKKTKNMKIFGYKQPNGRLTFIEELKRTDKNVTNFYYLCVCECGNYYILTNRHFDKNDMISCGCYRKERGADMCKNILGPNNGVDLLGKIFGDLEVVEKTEKRINNNIVWKCKCINCGAEQEAQATMLIRQVRMFCEKCSIRKSKGEKIISALLDANNIKYQREYTFKDCRFTDTNRLAIFDFYVDNKYIIEYDGEQHFKLEKFSNSITTEQAKINLQKIIQRDQYKNQYCKEHNIPIIRIPYTHLEQLCFNDLVLEKSEYLLKD